MDCRRFFLFVAVTIAAAPMPALAAGATGSIAGGVSECVPPSPPSPFDTTAAGRCVTYSNASLNGGGNTATVAPGALVSLSFDYVVDYTNCTAFCPFCIQQLYYGIRDEFSSCFTGNFQQNKAGSVNNTFTAPATPGYYYITQRSSLQFSCVGGNHGACDPAFALLIVESKSPLSLGCCIDTTSPSIDTQSAQLTVECDGQGNAEALNAWLNAQGGASATDCGDVTWSDDFVALSDGCGETGSADVIFTATDECGNPSDDAATFTIEDTVGPAISCGAPRVHIPFQTPKTFFAGAADVCCGDSPATSITAFDCPPGTCSAEIGGSTMTFTPDVRVGDVITWTVQSTDCCGNTTERDCRTRITKPRLLQSPAGMPWPIGSER